MSTLRLIGGAVFLFILVRIGEEKIGGILILAVRFGFAIAYERIAVRSESSSDAAIIIGIALALSLVAPASWHVITGDAQKTKEQFAPQKVLSKSEADRFLSSAPPQIIKLASDATEEHYRRTYATHSDADTLYESLGFQDWLAMYSVYQQIADKGKTQEIIEMFAAYKNQLK